MARDGFAPEMINISFRSFWRAVARILPRSTLAVALSLLVNVTALALTSSDDGKAPTQIVLRALQTSPLVVGSEEDFPPFATGKTDASAGGFTVDLWKAVAAEAGLKYTLRVRPFHQLLEEFKEGKIDVLINLAMSDARRQFADFTVPHVTVNGAIFVRKNEFTIHSEDDLTGKSIIVLNADLAHDYAVAKGWAKQLVVVDTAADGLRLLASNQHDVMLLSKLAGLQTLQALKLPNVQALPVKAGFSQKFAFATQHGRTDLLASLNEGLAITKANGVYNGLYEKWFGVYEPREVGPRDVLPYVMPVIVLFLIWLGYLFYRRNAERNLATAAIAESRDLLLAIIDTAPIRVFWKDRDLRYLGCNTLFAHDAGQQTPGDVIGKDDFQMGWAEEAELYRADDRAVLASGAGKLFYDEPQTTPSGQTILLRTSKVPLKNQRHETVGILGIYEDITVQKKAEESVRLAAQYARSLIEASLDPLVTISPQGKITDVNAATEEVTGLDRVALIGSDFADYFTDPGKAREGYQRAFWRNFVTDYPLSIRHKSGNVNQVLYNASVYRDGNGNVLGVFAAARDITKRKRAEDALKESEAFKNVILNSVDSEIAVLDYDGVILAVNDQWRRFSLLNGSNPGKLDRSVDVGANYLAVCEAVTGPESSEVRLTIEGIRGVLTGKSPSFDIEYPCHSPSELRWFRMVVLPLIRGANTGAVITHTNITERVRSQRIKESVLNQLTKLTSLVPGMFYQYRLRPDGHSCMPYASEAIREIYRVSPDEVREDASKVFGSIHPDDYEGMVASIKNSAANLTRWQFEYRVKFADGTVRWLFGDAVPEREDDGSTLWHGFITDITVRHQAEETLRKLYIAVEQSPASVVITDLDAKIEYVNPQFSKVSGYSPMEAIGKNPRILQSGQTPKEVYLELWEKLTSGQTWHGELVNKRKNGESYWEESHVAPVTGAKGNITHYVAIKTDVTERIREANKIAALMREQKAILDNELVGIVTVRDRKIVWANPAFEKMIGYEPGELAGALTRQMYLSDEDFQTFGAAAYPALDAGVVFRTRHEYVRKDGKHLWVDVSGGMLNPATGDSLWTFIDITHQLEAETCLIQSEAQIKGILEGAADAIFITDRKGNIQYLNNQASRMLKYSRDELMQMTRLDFLPGEESQKMLRQFTQLSSSAAVSSEFQVRCKDGQEIPVDFNSVVLPDGSVFSSCRDISERKNVEKRLLESESHLQAIIQNEPECIKIVDAEGMLVQMNPAGLAMIEADTLEQVKGVPVLGVIAPEHREAFASMHKRVIAGEAVQLEFEVLGLKGGRRWLQTHAVPMQDRGQTVHLAVTRDVTVRRQMEETIRQMAFHDSLTNLPNRRLMVDRLTQVMAASKRTGRYAALIFLDLDNFKSLNDAHGHGAGDLLLIEAASRLTHCVREIDTVARFGGDEFVVMLSDLHADRDESRLQAQAIAEKIRIAMSEGYELTIRYSDQPEITVTHRCTASIGLALFLGPESSQEDLFKCADAAMYQAKAAGRNTVRFYGVD